MIDRRVEIVAERRAERLFVALAHVECVHHRRPKIFALDGEKLADGLGLGLEPLHAALGQSERRAGGVDHFARCLMRGLRGVRGLLRLGERGLRSRKRRRQGRKIRGAGIGRGKSGIDIDEFGLEPRRALLVLGQGRLKLVAPRGQIGQRAGQFRERFLRHCKSFVRRRDTLIDAGKPGVVVLRRSLQRGFLGIEPGQRRLRIRRKRPLAAEVGGVLRDAAVELADALLGACFLAFERFARDQESLQGGGRLGFGLAKAGQHGGHFGLTRRGLQLLAGALGDDANRLVLGAFGFGDFGPGRDPAQVEQQRFGAAHLAGNVAIAHRLPRLRLEARHLRGQLPNDVFGPRQVCLGGFEAELRLVAASMQSGDAGGLFEDAPARFGARLDDLADAALMHQSRRTRAGRGVGEQHGDIAGADFLAVDAEGRSLFAHDAARHFQCFELVEGRGGAAIAVVDRHHDFGMIAPRPAGIAGEDDVVHLAGAHRFVGGLAHDPAHGLDEVRLAAAVRTDHAGQAGFDLKVGRFDEGFESDQAQPRQLHMIGGSIALAAAAKGIMKSSRRVPFCRSARGVRCRIGAEINRRESERNRGCRIIQTFRAPAEAAAQKMARRPAWLKRKTLILP